MLKRERPHPSLWNFRQAFYHGQPAEPATGSASHGTPVFGVGQGHLDGVEWMLRHLGASGFSRVLCFNMRGARLALLASHCSPRVSRCGPQNGQPRTRRRPVPAPLPSARHGQHTRHGHHGPPLAARSRPRGRPYRD